MSRAKPISIIGLSAALGVTLGGCSQLLPPTFTTEGIREVEQVDGRSQMVFVMNAKNANKQPIPLEQVKYRVLLDGQEVYSGLRSPEVTLPGFSSMIFELPAVVDSDLIRPGHSVAYSIDGTVIYHRPGVFAEVMYDSNLKIPEAEMHTSGTLELGD